MIHYTAHTLVDISKTNDRYSDKLSFYQQQNLNTLIQTIGLRSQPLDTKIGCNMAQDIVEYGFGTEYKGLHTVWSMTFSIEHNNIFNKESQKTFYLLKDVDGVAIYTNLEETANINTKCFETYDTKFKNIVFYKVQPDT